MGLIRKTASVSTLGLVNYRTDRQASKRNARLQRRHNRITSAATVTSAKYQRDQVNLMRQQQHAGPPPGWHVDSYDPRYLRWWNGSTYTDQIMPRP